MLRHVDLHIVGDAAQERVVAGDSLENAPGYVRCGLAVSSQPGNEPLPGHGRAWAAHAVEPEAPVLGAEDVGRSDGCRLRRHPAPVSAEGVQGVLHDRHRGELDDAGCGLLPLVEAAELLGQARLPEGDVATPADATVAAVGAADVGDHL